MYSVAYWEAAMEREGPEGRAGRERRHDMADEIRKLQLVRERLLGVDEVAKTYPEGHDMRVRLENLGIESAIEAVDEELRDLWDRTLHPRGT